MAVDDVLQVGFEVFGHGRAAHREQLNRHSDESDGSGNFLRGNRTEQFSSWLMSCSAGLLL